MVENTKVEHSTSKVESQDIILSNSEKEVLALLTIEMLTIRQIALKRGKSVQSVYKIVNKLKQRGVFDSGFNVVEKVKSTIQPLNTPNQIRLHGQEFNIQILFKDYKYNEIAKKSNTISIDDSTIRLYKDTIEVYCHRSFYADDCQKATARSMAYFDRLFRRLEHDLKVIIIKPRSQNIRLVNQHYAETNNELSKECEVKGDRIRVYADDDGKLWFTLDNSFNLHEAETQHPKTAKHDMQDIVRPFFNDLRTNEAVTMSDIKKMLFEVVREEKEIATGLNIITQIIKKQYEPEQEPIDDSKNKNIQNYFG